jgi:exopolysaccharide biosynthesis polyprenyl glycosylphosphotransferase
LSAHPPLRQQFLGPSPAPAAQVLTSIDPLVTIGVLLLCAAMFGARLDSAYMILALLVFSLTFPGSTLNTASVGTIARRVAGSWCATVALLLLIGWATRTVEAFDQRVLAAWLLVTPVARVGAHVTIPQLLLRLLADERKQRVAVIAGFFDDRSADRSAGIRSGAMLGKLDQLAAYAKAHRVDIIYITLPMASQQRIVQLLNDLQDTTASIYFAPDIFLCDLIQARVTTIGALPVMSVCETPFAGFNGVLKRTSDIVLSLAICALILPVLFGIAVGVKLSSPGPVIFRQRRYGLDGQEIVVYKFRSMTVTEDGAVVRQATRADGRVTRFGALLRRYSLDELPQFINVLQGRMSIVGPRPHAVVHTEMYRKLIRGYMIRHKVKPGITGWAQVNGLRGETNTLDRMEQRIAYDLAYLRRWSLGLDLWIVLKTILIILRDPNAY